MFLSILFVSVFLFAAPISAETVKFIYVYNGAGQLLSPINTANQCPDPEGGNGPAEICRGVAVDNNGDYSLRLRSADLSNTENFVFFANQYRFVAAGSHPSVTGDVYVLLDSKRRVDDVTVDAINTSLDINLISEATVHAVEGVYQLPQGRAGTVGTLLGDVLGNLNANDLNHAMGNGRADNAATDAETQRQREMMQAQQNTMGDEKQAVLARLAEVAVLNVNDPVVNDYLRKNVIQAVSDPDYMTEVLDRVFSHVAAVQAAGSGESVMILDADRYVIYPQQVANLTTERSLNPDGFFAYTWNGVDSITPVATFTHDNTGDFLVCATGEISGGNDSSIDCLRLLVKDEVEAVATYSERRVPEGAVVNFSGRYSVGADTYSWSGHNTISNNNMRDAIWTAPQVPGIYTFTLSINGGEDSDIFSIEVYDIQPVAIAQADKEMVYLDDANETITFLSSSISTDGTSVESLLWQVVGQPDGANPVTSDSSAASFQFTADMPGLYTIRLTASKNGGADSTELIVQVREHGVPVANAGPDKIAFRHQEVMLDGSYSYGVDGLSITPSWATDGGMLGNINQLITPFASAEMGVFTATLTVNDGLKSAMDSVNIEVKNRVPAASDAVVANVLNELLQGLLVAVDGDGDTLTYSLVSEPQNGGVTIDPLTGAFTYAPGGNKGCHYSPYARPQLNDQGGKNVPVIKLCADKYVIAPGETVNLITANSINATKLQGHSWVNATPDVDDVRLATFVSGDVGLHEVCVVGNIGNSANTSTACVEILVDGAASGDGPVEDGYVDCFTYNVSDGMDVSKDAQVCLTIGWKNVAPEINDLSIAVMEDTRFSDAFVATDFDGHPITFHMGDNPSLGSVVIDAASGNYTYTPNENVNSDLNGVDTFTVLAHDGFGFSIAATVTVSIAAVNDVPVAFFAGSVSTDEDTSITGMLGAMDPDGDMLDIRLVVQGAKGDVIITDAQSGAFIYNPHLNENGGDSFYFVVNDGAIDGNLEQVIINVAPVNDAPVAADMGPLTAYSDTGLNGQLAGSDVDEDALVYSIVASPAKGTVSIEAETGTFIFTPDGAQLGADSFSYRVSDGLLTSSVATVGINILLANTAPVAIEQVINVVEGMTYGGTLTGIDPENAPLNFALTSDGRLGGVELINAANGEFEYTATAPGTDFFSFTTSDGSKTSTAANVTVNVISAANFCAGPNSFPVDADGDGYADYVEAHFGTAANDDSVTPFGLDSVAEGVSFIDDDDSDGYLDYIELWLSSDYTSDVSKPSASRLTHLPNCMLADGDFQPPAMQAFSVLTPVVDIDATPTSAIARFAITALDNAAGIAAIDVLLNSPSGAELPTHLTVSDAAKVLYAEFDSTIFSRYAEAGIWTVEELKVTDVRGHVLLLTYADLVARGFDHSLTVINSLGDALLPNLDLFNVLTPTVDLTAGDSVAAFRVEANDSPAGIGRIHVNLRSPSGDVYRWAETRFSGNQTSVAVDINSNAFDSFAEPGVWTVTELALVDEAGNKRIYTTTDLTGSGYPVEVTVISNLDTTPPMLDFFEIITDVVDPTPGDVRAACNVTVSDTQSGVHNVVVTLTSPSGFVLLSSHNALDDPTTLNTRIDSEAFAKNAEGGIWSVSQVDVVDASGNVASYNTADLSGAGFETEVHVVRTCGGVVCVPNQPPVAQGMGVITDEDVAVSDRLVATDEDAHELIFSIVDNGELGRAVITDSATGAFTYTPNENAHGTDIFTFKADDGYNESNIATVIVTINPIPDMPIGRDIEIEVLRNTLFSGGLHGEDIDGDAVTFSIDTNGSLGTATIVDANTGEFIYMPNTDALGNDTFSYLVNDGALNSVINTVTVHVVPEFGISAFTVITPTVNNQDGMVWIIAEAKVSIGNSQIDAAWVTLTGPSGQTIPMAAINLSLDNDTAITLAAQVDPTAVSLESGVWTFNNLRALRKSTVASILVADDIGATGFNDEVQVLSKASPIANNDSITTPLGTVYFDTLSATDADGDRLTYRLIGNGSPGLVTLLDASTGEYSFTPQVIGAGSFSFQVNDGLSDAVIRGIVSVTVTDPGDGIPVASDNTHLVDQNIAFLGHLIASDPNANPLIYSIVNMPAHGRLDIINASTGEFAYHPDVDYLGADSFTFKVNDGTQDSNIATVTLNIAIPNGTPVANSETIMVLQNTPHSETLNAVDPNGDAMTYQLHFTGNLGSVMLDTNTGDYTYTPNTDVLGRDFFIYSVSDGVNHSAQVTVWVDIVSLEQICGTGGIKLGFDTDADGWADVVEVAFATDASNAGDTPAGLDGDALGVSFINDDDGDGIVDYQELWLGSDKDIINSVPELYVAACFNPASDGIKPRLLGFQLATPTVDLNGSDTAVSFDMTLLDNASGIRRARVSLRSPAGVLVTKSLSYANFPLLTGLRMTTDPLGEFAEAGIWDITGLTLFDEAGNRLDLSADDLSEAGFASNVTISNSNGDAIGPNLDSFVMTKPIVYPGTGAETMTFSLTLSDSGAGVSSARVDMVSPSGVIVSAVNALADPLATVTMSLETPVLSDHLEQGIWNVLSVLVVDAAGNSVEYVDTLSDLGFATSLQSTNPQSDNTAPLLESFAILTPEVFPAGGSALMSFSATVSDDLAGVEQIRVDLRGPSGQTMYAWGNYSSNFPLSDAAQVETSILSTLLEEGVWTVETVVVFDAAGNSHRTETEVLSAAGMATEVQVRY